LNFKTISTVVGKAAKVIGQEEKAVAEGVTGAMNKLAGKMVDRVLVFKDKIYNHVPTNNKIKNFAYDTAKKAGGILGKWSEKGLAEGVEKTPQRKVGNLVYKTVGNAVGTVTAFMAGKKVAKADDDEEMHRVVQSYVTRAATMGILD
jgi:hypothetical protein